MIFKKFKRANIPVTILVLGVLVVCGLAIFSFYLGNNQVKGSISDISIIETAKLDMEKLEFYIEDLGLDEEKAKELLDIASERGYEESVFREKGDLKVIYPIS